jgi:peptidoglycan/xylan/chitin deacetylase (PgdA/CDA1 family)
MKARVVKKKLCIMEVIMFHSIGCVNSSWSRNYLTIEWRHFESFCEYLVNNKIETLTLEEWYVFDPDLNTSSSRKKVVLTFDDGYLDNWVYAYPILKKYNLKGTIFINPEFVDPSEEPRANLDDYWKKEKSFHELKFLGFLNWAEIRLMDESKILDVQSHSMSHNFYFKNSQIIDIYTGQRKYDWMAWNYNPVRKPFYMNEDQRKMVPYGTPIFEFGRALSLRRFLPSEDLNQFAVDFYKQSVANSKDKTETFKQDFIAICDSFIANNTSALKRETDQEMELRYRYELFESKKIIEENLNKNVEFLCWPGGGYNELSIKLSIEAGYKASTLASSEDIGNLDNSILYKRIVRFGLSPNIHTPKKVYVIPYNKALVHWYKLRENSIYKIPVKCFSITFKIWDKFFNYSRINA